MAIANNREGKPAKRRNHTVPRALLKRWLVDGDEGQGYWVLDCQTNSISFHQGKEAAFAISSFRYVPVRQTTIGDAYRDESLEDWFSSGENDLAAVMDRVIASQSLALKPDDLGGFIQAAILLGFRSAYEFEQTERLFREKNRSLSDDEVGRNVVDVFQKVYAAKLRQFQCWDFLLMTNLGLNLLVCDRPMFDMTVHEPPQQGLMIPLAPDILLVATPPDQPARGHLTLRVIKGRQNLATMANKMTVERARRFIVGEHGALSALRQHFEGDQFKSRAAADTFRVFVTSLAHK